MFWTATEYSLLIHMITCPGITNIKSISDLEKQKQTQRNKPTLTASFFSRAIVLIVLCIDSDYKLLPVCKIDNGRIFMWTWLQKKRKSGWVTWKQCIRNYPHMFWKSVWLLQVVGTLQKWLFWEINTLVYWVASSGTVWWNLLFSNLQLVLISKMSLTSLWQSLEARNNHLHRHSLLSPCPYFAGWC